MAEISQTFWIFLAAEVLYLAAFSFGVLCALCENRRVWLGRVAAGTLLAGCIIQFAGLYLRGAESGVLPLRNTFEFLQVLGLSSVVAMGALRIVWAMRVPAMLTSALAVGLSGLGLINVSAWDVVSEVSEKNPWISAHAVLAIVGYAFWTAAALVWVAYFLQNRALRMHKTNHFYTLLPDLASLDRVSGRLVAFGIVSLSASVIVGAINLFEGMALSPVFAGYKIFISAVLICGNTWLVVQRRSNRITGRVFAVRGLLLFAVGVILLGGFTCMRTFTGDAAGTELPKHQETESAGDVR